MRTLTTKDLILEPLCVAHADAMYPVLCEPELQTPAPLVVAGTGIPAP